MADERPERVSSPDAPLGDLADRIRSRNEPSIAESADAAVDGLFQEEPFEGVESDDLWEAMDDATALGPEVEAGSSRNEHIIPKRGYCEGCEHFSAPPDIHCNHAGTSIIEFTDIDHVRVRNCPVVAERQALGERDKGRMTPGTFGSQ